MIRVGDFVRLGDTGYRGRVDSIEDGRARSNHGVPGTCAGFSSALGHLVHCAPTPLPEQLPVGTMYAIGRYGIRKITAPPRLSKNNRCWAGGSRINLSDGDVSECLVDPNYVDWASYHDALHREEDEKELDERLGLDSTSVQDAMSGELFELSAAFARLFEGSS